MFDSIEMPKSKRFQYDFENVFQIGLILISLALMIVGFSYGAFAPREDAERALIDEGYTDVRIVDSAWFFISARGCSESDSARFTAIAKNSQGQEVTLYVCSGWPFKGLTVRHP